MWTHAVSTRIAERIKAGMEVGSGGPMEFS